MAVCRRTYPESAGAAAWQTPAEAELISMSGGQQMPMGNMPGMRTELSPEAIQNPVSLEEVNKGSIKEMLSRMRAPTWWLPF